MRTFRTSSFLRVTALTVAFVLACAPAAVAAPSTPQIAAKQAEAKAAQAKLDDMRADLEMQVEEYNRVDDALRKTRGLVGESRDKLAREDRNLRAAQDLLQRRAEGIYRGGDVDVLEVLLGTTSFEDFLTRVDLLMRIGTSDAQLVSSVKDARQQVAQTKRVLEQREAEQVALRAQVDEKRKRVESAVARQDEYLSSLNSQVAQLIKAEEERLRREAEARAKALAAAQAALAARTHVVGGRAASSNPGDGHPEAVGLAMKYLGVPYVWGGTTPNGFDCSGLVQYVYAQLGISIPRVSQDQYRAGEHIAADKRGLLKPGDLLFFGRNADPDRVHHVVMYAGGDDIIEAPYSGARVRVASLQERLSHGEYVGASRF